jgi:hypothetical protein
MLGILFIVLEAVGTLLAFACSLERSISYPHSSIPRPHAQAAAFSDCPVGPFHSGAEGSHAYLSPRGIRQLSETSGRIRLQLPADC